MTLQELVRDTIGLLEGEAPTTEDAAALARLVGLREEWLAHVLLCRRSLDAYPEIVAAIKLAATAIPGPANERPERGDQGGCRRQEFLALDAAVQTLVTDAASTSAQASTEAAMRQFKLRD